MSKCKKKLVNGGKTVYQQNYDNLVNNLSYSSNSGSQQDDANALKKTNDTNNKNDFGSSMKTASAITGSLNSIVGAIRGPQPTLQQKDYSLMPATDINQSYNDMVTGYNRTWDAYKKQQEEINKQNQVGNAVRGTIESALPVVGTLNEIGRSANDIMFGGSKDEYGVYNEDWKAGATTILDPSTQEMDAIRHAELANKNNWGEQLTLGAVDVLLPGIGAVLDNQERRKTADKMRSMEAGVNRAYFENLSKSQRENAVPMITAKNGLILRQRLGSNKVSENVEVQKNEMKIRQSKDGSYQVIEDYKNAPSHSQGGADVDVVVDDIIIPADKRDEVTTYISNNRWDLVDKVVGQLPKVPIEGQAEGGFNYSDRYLGKDETPTFPYRSSYKFDEADRSVYKDWLNKTHPGDLSDKHISEFEQVMNAPASPVISSMKPLAFQQEREPVYQYNPNNTKRNQPGINLSANNNSGYKFSESERGVYNDWVKKTYPNDINGNHIGEFEGLMNAPASPATGGTKPMTFHTDREPVYSYELDPSRYDQKTGAPLKNLPAYSGGYKADNSVPGTGGNESGGKVGGFFKDWGLSDYTFAASEVGNAALLINSLLRDPSKLPAFQGPRQPERVQAPTIENNLAAERASMSSQIAQNENTLLRKYQESGINPVIAGTAVGAQTNEANLKMSAQLEGMQNEINRLQAQMKFEADRGNKQAANEYSVRLSEMQNNYNLAIAKFRQEENAATTQERTSLMNAIANNLLNWDDRRLNREIAQARYGIS